MVKNNSYDEKVNNVLRKEGIKSNLSFVAQKPYFDKNEESRNVYKLNLTKGNEKVSFKYGDSLNNTREGIKAKPYEVLGSVVLDKRSAESVNSYEDVQNEFGYEDKKQAKKVYTALKSNEEKYDKIFSPEAQEKLNKIYEDY